MDYFRINFELPLELREQILEFSRSYEWVQCFGSNSSIYMNMDGIELSKDLSNQVTSYFKMKPNMCALTRIPPKKEVLPHIDGDVIYTRNSVIMFPLQPYSLDYAPYHAIESGEYVSFSPCFVVATSHIHGVKNNEYERINLQLSYGLEIEDMYEAHCQGLLLHDS